MTNPYRKKQKAQFWKHAVTNLDPQSITPMRPQRYQFPAGTRIATAGSCFAQNMAKRLRDDQRVCMLFAEEVQEGLPCYSAQYGNIYTPRQLVQLIEEAFERRTPADAVAPRNGRYIDLLRPEYEKNGFSNEAALREARNTHLAAVRDVIQNCDVFVFTLGLTECWRSKIDGTVYPLSPSVVSDDADNEKYEFYNLTYQEIVDDIGRLVDLFREFNAPAHIILTVSPVPLIATYTDEHVLVATCSSKSILRAACSAAESTHSSLLYFPAYEIVTGPFSKGSYFKDDLRSVTPQAIDHVMRVFEANFLPDKRMLFSEGDAAVICDEESITKSIGF